MLSSFWPQFYKRLPTKTLGALLLFLTQTLFEINDGGCVTAQHSFAKSLLFKDFLFLVPVLAPVHL